MESLIKFIPHSINQYEEWIPVRGYENDFMISNMGRLFDCNNGYICISTRIKGEKYLYYTQISQYAHIAMMRSFCYFPGCEKKYVNHKDGCTLLNYLPNLEWVDYPISIQCNGNNGDNSYMAKYTNDQIREVCNLLETGAASKEISKITGIPKHIVDAVKGHHSWKEISKDYTFKTEPNKKWCKYSDDTIRSICQMLQDNPKMTIKEISDKLGVHKHLVQRIGSRQQRADISKDYTWAPMEDRNYNNRNIEKKEEVKRLLETSDLSIKEIANKAGVTTTIVYNVNDKYNIRKLKSSNQYANK